MTIIRSPRTTPFTVLPNDALRDRVLSFKARGVLAYLLSMPDGWQTSSERLARVGPDGRDSIRSALRELEDRGYLLRVRRRQPDGTFTTETIVHDVPIAGRDNDPPEPVGNAGENPPTFPPPGTAFPASDNPASKERTTKKDGATQSLNRTREGRHPRRRVCGDCSGTGWTAGHDAELGRCSCDGGTRP